MKLLSMSAFLCVIAASGCMGGRSVTGQWSFSLPGMQQGSDAVVEFRADQTMVISAGMAFPGGSGSIKLTMPGTWKLEGELMTIQASDLQISSEGLSGLQQAAFEAGKARFEKGRTEMMKAMSTTEPSKMEWIDDNSFTLSLGGSNSTFTRVGSGGITPQG